MLTDTRRRRRLRDPAHHLFRRLFLRDGRLCRPDPARHHLSGTPRLHLLLDRPICEADAAADAIRWPVVEPDRPAMPTCAASSRCWSTWPTASACPASSTSDGSPKWRDYADYIVHHERRPGIGPLIGLARRRQPDRARRTQPGAARPLHREWRLLRPPHPGRGAVLQALEHRLPGLGGGDSASSTRPSPISSRSGRTAAPLPARRRGPRRPPAARAPARPDQRAMDPLPIWYDARPAPAARAFRSTPSPSARWRCITPGAARTPGCGSCTGRTRSTCRPG